MTLLFLCLIATAVLAGVLQGGYHIRPSDEMHCKWWTEQDLMDGGLFYDILGDFNLGIRGWKWQKYEHAMMYAVYVGCGIIGWWFIEHAELSYHFAMLTVLVAVLANDLFEYAYSYARFKTLINPFSENFTVGDLKVKIPWHKYTSKPKYILGETLLETVKVRKWIQILPFHASSKTMHWIRAGLILILGGLYVR